jgi:hypothetical protein
LNINITAVTSKTKRVLERFVSSIFKDRKESLEKGELCFSTSKGKKGLKNQELMLIHAF